MKQQDFFNRYNYSTRTDKLGGGTFGTVYKAYDKVLDKTVAIKIAEVKVFGDKEFSLLDEFDAIKGLPAHQNIANYDSVYTFEQPNGVYDYAIIQYYPDGNLSQLIKHKNLSFTEKEEIALQVLDGLAFLHKHKVVHRDMKPSNVLVHKRSISGKTEYIPKIADFGLSKKADPNAQSRFTNSFGGGTLEYSSPEQLKGRNLRFNTDLWAWAVISYELLTGKMLFQATGSHSTGSAEREKEIYEQITSKDISSLLSELPKKWQEALSRCLERNPDNRIKTAKEIKAILVDEIPVQDTPTQPINTDTEQTIAETNNNEQKPNKSKLPLYIGLVAVLGVIGFLGSQWLNQQPIKKNEKQRKLEKEIRKKYDYVYKFEEGLVGVRKNGKYGFINKNGKEVIPLIYDFVRSFEGGLAEVEKNGKWGFINKSGKEVIPFIYDSVWSFDEGLARVEKNGKYGFINKNGKAVIPFIYDDVSYMGFKEGRVKVKKNGKEFYINKQGKCVEDCD